MKCGGILAFSLFLSAGRRRVYNRDCGPLGVKAEGAYDVYTLAMESGT